MSPGEQASTGQPKGGTGKLFGPSAKNNSETTDESRLSEYTAPGSGHVQTPEISDGEQLPQEWELEEPADTNAPSEEDILQRLDRIEKRLDAFENTGYTFLLYAKQLTDRTVSFFEDILALVAMPHTNTRSPRHQLQRRLSQSN